MFITRSSDSERLKIRFSGKFEVVENLASFNRRSAKSHAGKMVGYSGNYAWKSLAQKLTTAYSVSDRSNTLRSMDEVRSELNYQKTVYNREIQKDRAKKGKKTGQNILVRF